MTVAGYQSIDKDVRGKSREVLRYNASGIYPGPGEHAHL